MSAACTLDSSTSVNVGGSGSGSGGAPPPPVGPGPVGPEFGGSEDPSGLSRVVKYSSSAFWKSLANDTSTS